MDSEQDHPILVVDDDDGMRSALCRLLGAAGYATRAFASAEEAQASSLVLKASCLVIDVHLSGLTGTDWYATLGASRPPAVFVTAFDSELVRASALEAGGCAYLTKPFNRRALLQAVEGAIRAGHAG